jgi:hypothetical protein
MFRGTFKNFFLQPPFELSTAYEYIKKQQTYLNHYVHI